MPTLARLKSFYEEANETGWKDRLWESMEFSKNECQEAYDFIVSFDISLPSCLTF